MRVVKDLASSPYEALGWIFFCFTSFQLAFLQPYLVIIPGERVNLFSGLLCALTLGVCCLSARKGGVTKKSPEVLISLILAVLMILSGLFSLTPVSSSLRGLTVLASGLGGFWCARILLADAARQRFILRFSLLLLSGILLLCLISYARWGEVARLLDNSPHPLEGRILILWWAPLTLLLNASIPGKVAAGLLLALSYLVFLLSDLRAVVLIPLLLGLLAAYFRVVRFRYILLLLIPLLVITINFFHRLPKEKLGRQFEPTYYRLENYPFSWHIAVQHPVWGIGLRAPREEFLKDYEVKYPYVTREDFLGSVRHKGTSENTFLTLLVGAGFPFVALYLFSLFILLARLVHSVNLPKETSGFPPLALLLPITAALLHFLVFDGLLFPQVSWFFHLLLGLIPGPGDSQTR
ncbi:MAG: O-antigen ligase family protein [Thermodesulfobacteriota bacterium]